MWKEYKADKALALHTDPPPPRRPALHQYGSRMYINICYRFLSTPPRIVGNSCIVYD
ncbi:hypothetical protein PI125_g21844, partial [Phytophthora idaei]